MLQIFNNVNKSKINYGKHHRLLQSMSADSVHKKLRQTGAALLLCGTAHVGSMMTFEKMNVVDATWLTATTLSTVGYGDLSAKSTLGRLATILLLYGPGVALLARGAGLAFEASQIKRDSISKGKWKWVLDNHIVILNSPKNNAEDFLNRAVSDLRNSGVPGANNDIILVTPDFSNGLPIDLMNLRMAHVCETVTNPQAFTNSNLAKAGTIVILCKDENDPLSDSLTYDLIAKARAENPNAQIIAEAYNPDMNKQRFIDVGADQVLSITRGYPELLASAIVRPGVESLAEDIMDSHGTLSIPYGVAITDTWKNITTKLIENDIGIPQAFIDKNGQIINAAAVKPSDIVTTTSIILQVRGGNVQQPQHIARILTSNDAEAAQAVILQPKIENIAVLNAPKFNAEAFFDVMTKDLRNSGMPGANATITIVSSDMPPLSSNLKDRGISQINETVIDPKATNNTTVKGADVIVVLSRDETDPLSDSLTFDLISRAHIENPNARIIAEMHDKSYKDRFVAAGAHQVLHATRGYPALLTSAIIRPGVEALVEDVIDSHGAKALNYDINHKGTWGQIAKQMFSQDIGAPLAYIDINGKLVNAAVAGKDETVEIASLIVQVRDGNVKEPAEVLALLNGQTPLPAAQKPKFAIRAGR